MAINSYQLCGDKTLKSVYSVTSKESALTQCRLVKINYANGSITSTTSNRRMKSKLSPYLPGDRLQLLAHHTKQSEFLSSFPLAMNIYKANSDEFKLKNKRSKKNKKSVLTLPNEPSALPQSCTVSDMNDSEYFNSEKQSKAKKRLKLQIKKKFPRREKNLEFYDRDAKYCSQVNIDLDCSSTDMIKNFKGDRKNKLEDFYNTKMKNDEEVQPHDVWAVLRNINRFQFHPSPRMSDDSILMSPRKKKSIMKKNKRKAARVIETCRTEQYAYISNIDVGCKSPSPISSIDRITVIQGNVKEIGNKQINQPQIQSSFKTKIKGEKLVKNKPKNRKVHNQLKLLCSPVVRKNEERNTYNEAELGCCRMIKNNNNDSLALSRRSHTSDDLASHKDDDSFRDSSCRITTEVEFAHSSRSGSNFSISGRKGKDNKPWKLQFHDSHTKLNGTTKIALSKGQELTLTKRQSLPRKPRLVTTMPSSGPVPKLTQTDIRRRLANIKFPIVILGKEDVSATIAVEPYDYLQFDGLDKHIWPFMLEWSEKRKDVLNPDTKEKTNYISPLDNNLADVKKPTNFLALNKQSFKIKKLTVAEMNLTSIRHKELKTIPANHVNNIPVKPKPIRQFRDKMLKLLYKKTSSQNVVNENLQADGGQGDIMVEVKPKIEKKRYNTVKNDNKDKTIDTYSRSGGDKIRDAPCLRQVPTSPSNLFVPKQQWGKAKWASAIIDNVIKKIRSGAYYNHDNSEMDSKIRKINDSKEVSIQAGVPLNSIGINAMEGYEDLTPKITILKKREPPTYLPGFDDELPQLEIKSMTRNQIAVKHCVTNVMLQFDVCVPLEQEQASANFKRSMSCIPLTITESKTKVFKCKARIVNAMLPAEICSILPKLMNKLENPDGKLALPSVQETSVDSCLSTITELSDLVSTYTSITPLISYIIMSPELRILVNGSFPVKIQPPSICRRKYKLDTIDLPSLLELLPKLRIHNQYYPELRPEYPLTSKPDKLNIPSIEISAPEPNNLCTDLVLFNPAKASAPVLWNQCSKFAQCMLNKFYNLMQRGMPNSTLNLNSAHIPDFEMKPLCDNITVNLNFGNPNEISNHVSIDVRSLKVESLYSAFSNIVSPKITKVDSSSPLKCIEYIKHVDKPKMNKIATKSTQPNVVVHKHKKRVFVKLYKKCKSTSHISVEKSGSTSLSKITNMEEFLQALGTNKPLCDAFDGYSGRKILASIIEMKCWITEISPRQALLVLLLSNKKDTSNLVRFRPVILQGIAVNRITRTSELDMEIEVIERESFHKLSEHEGISDVPNSVQYDDNLLEELYWIAKTTASDYQRVFDESSEKLLKALLEKRKKLNPSYLRVMARYVGLGLLKSPAKN